MENLIKALALITSLQEMQATENQIKLHHGDTNGKNLYVGNSIGKGSGFFNTKVAKQTNKQNGEPID